MRNDRPVSYRRILFAAFLILSISFCSVGAVADSDTFRFVIIGDTHITDDTYQGTETAVDLEGNKAHITVADENLKVAVKKINEITPRPDFVIVVGDVTHNFSQPLEYYMEHRCHHDISKEILDKLDMPWYGVIGNHDYNKHFDPDGMAKLANLKWGKEIIGEEGYYFFDHKGIRFIVLNQYRCNTTTSAGKISSFCLGDEQFDWLTATLETDLPVFVFAHAPQMRESFDLEEFENGTFKTLMEDSRDKIKVFFYGHMHRFMKGDAFMNYGMSWYLVGSTRFNPDARYVIDVHSPTGKYRIANKDEFRWMHY